MLEDAATAAITALMGEPVYDEASFEQVRAHVAGHAQGVMARIIADVVRILQAAREVRRAARRPARRGARPTCAATSRRRSGGSSSPASSAPPGAKRLPDVERYLRGAAWRLERLTKTPAVDRDRMRAIHELEDAHRRVLEELPAGVVDGELSEVPWLLEELRISYFAQAIGPKGQPSAKRIRRILEDSRPLTANDPRQGLRAVRFLRRPGQPCSAPQADMQGRERR